MVKKNPAPADRFKLPPETQTRLQDMTPNIEKAEHSINTLKELGIDTSELEEKLVWAKKVKETLLREFG